jgi:hypothetical protein
LEIRIHLLQHYSARIAEVFQVHDNLKENSKPRRLQSNVKFFNKYNLEKILYCILHARWTKQKPEIPLIKLQGRDKVYES